MSKLIVLAQEDDGYKDIDSDSALIIIVHDGKFIFNEITYNFSNTVELSKILEREFVFSDVIVNGSILNFSSEVNVRTLFSTFIGISQESFEYIDRENIIKSRADLLTRVFNALDINPIYKKYNGSVSLKVENKTSNWSEFEQQLVFNEINKNMVSPASFLTELESALENKEAYSFLRVHHCENRFLGYGFSYSHEEIGIACKSQFGCLLNKVDICRISALIKHSVINCNSIGIPTLKKLSSNRIHLLEKSTFNHLRILNAHKNKSFTPVNIHEDLLKSSFFNKLLMQANRLYIITHKDISNLTQMLGRNIIQIPISTELVATSVEKDEKHYPDVFMKISDFIKEEIKPGDLVLIGAGVLGTIYCDLIKNVGGIALDLEPYIDIVLDVNYQKNGYKK